MVIYATILVMLKILKINFIVLKIKIKKILKSILQYDKSALKNNFYIKKSEK